MSTIATLTSGENGANSLTDINNNFSNLNADKVEGQTLSVDSEVALFSGTGGKTIKRASATGLAKLASGVLSTVTAPAGTVVGDTDTQTLTNKTLTTPTVASFANANHNHQNAAGGGTLAESALSLSDVTTNDVSAAKHGFVPKAPNTGSKFLRDDSTWANISSDIPTYYFPSTFESSTNYSTSVGGSGAATIPSGQGAHIDTGSTATSMASVLHNPTGAAGNAVALFARASRFSTRINMNTVGASFQALFGVYDFTSNPITGSGITFTKRGYGFKLIGASSVYTLSATNADGTTETTTSLGTLAVGDWVDLMAVFDGSTKVDYYWSKNGGTWSSVTTQTTNLPTSASTFSTAGQCWGVTNAGVAVRASLLCQQGLFIG